MSVIHLKCCLLYTSVENKRAESHRNYIDIQYLFTGKEVQGYAPLLPGVTGEEPAGKDNIFYDTVENEDVYKRQVSI